MPTGYTNRLAAGEVTELADYALICARYFDLGAGDVTPEGPIREPSTEDIDTFRAQLAILRPPETDRAAYLTWLQEEESRRSDLALENQQVSARYAAMYEKVEDWDPDTREMQTLRTFMLEQLRTGRDVDICVISDAALPSYEEWVAMQGRNHLRRVEHLSESLTKAVERYNRSRAWIQKLEEELL